VRAAASFDCSVCGKPLGMRRVRQGLTAHPGCRHVLPPAAVDLALGLAHATLARVRNTNLAGNRELALLLLQATRQAAQLIQDLQRLRSGVGKPRPKSNAPSTS
jgi:hypothetical protein